MQKFKKLRENGANAKKQRLAELLSTESGKLRLSAISTSDRKHARKLAGLDSTGQLITTKRGNETLNKVIDSGLLAF